MLLLATCMFFGRGGVTSILCCSMLEVFLLFLRFQGKFYSSLFLLIFFLLLLMKRFLAFLFVLTVGLIGPIDLFRA